MRASFPGRREAVDEDPDGVTPGRRVWSLLGGVGFRRATSTVRGRRGRGTTSSKRQGTTSEEADHNTTPPTIW